jgi:3-oxoacyl-[acyl-carrier-protein] synthase III
MGFFMRCSGPKALRSVAAGRLRESQLVCLMALGAGFHWGSVLVRV